MKKITLLLIMLFAIKVFPNPPLGKALYLDGMGDFVKLNEIVITTTTFTIEVWANMFGPSYGNREHLAIFEQRNQSVRNGSSTIVLFTPDSNNDMVFQRVQQRSC